MDWQHGYHADGTYTCGFYRELAPSWLDFACLLKGQPSPRRHPDDPFHYLELGSGMGLGLCLLAATHPEGQFVGVDFQPDHILHSRRLSEALQLRNIRFVEADFLRLADDPGDLCAAYHYVVAHGIATWIAQPVRQALLTLAAESLIPGGLFYCSYNTLPGWLGAYPLQQLAWLEAQRRASTPAGAADAVRQAALTLQALLATTEDPSALAMSLPGLRDRLNRLPEMDSAYLVQEYINQGWQPLTVQALHTSVSACKLRYVASAALPDNFPRLLPANVHDSVMAETDPLIREFLQDLAINQSFRRDVFSRGVDTLSATELTAALRSLRFRLQEAPAQDVYLFATSFGQIQGNSEICIAVEALLVAGPQAFGELQDRLNFTVPDLAQLLSLLMHAGRIGLDRGDRAQAAMACSDTVNGALAQLQLAGRPYHFRAAPAIGSAVALSLPEALLEHSGLQAADQDLQQMLTSRLEQLGRSLLGEAEAVIQVYEQRRLALESLGALSSRVTI